MNFLQRLAQVINSNGYANQVVVMSATDPLYGNVSAVLPPTGDGFDRLFTTLQAAVDSGAIVPYRGDEILVAPGSLDAAVVIPHMNVLTGTTNGGFKIVGLGNPGEAAIAPTTVGASALVIHANDVTLENLDLAGESTAATSVSGTGSRLTLVNCKIEGGVTAFSYGPGSAAAVAAGTAGHGGDLKLIDCEVCWSTNGLAFAASDYGAATQILVKGLRVHNVSGTEILGVPGAFGIGSVRNLEVVDGIFDRMEDGTAPTDFVNLNTAFDTGIFTNNSFALATNAIGDLKVGAGVLWVANATEAGTSTARPA